MGTSRLRSRDGQLFTADLVVSSLIFLFIVNIALLTWNTAYDNRTMFVAERDLRNQVIRMSGFLVRTPGYPANWTATTADIVGFTTDDHVIDNQKLSEFRDMAYADQQRAIRSHPDEFYLTLEQDGSDVFVPYTGGGNFSAVFGKQPTAATTAAVNQRRVLVDTVNSTGLQSATLKLVFWR